VSRQHLSIEDSTNSTEPVAAPRVAEDYDNISAQLNDDESMPDDITVASASFMGDDDRYDASQPSTGHRKRKREEQAQNAIDQAHIVYSDELLDFFMLSADAAAITPKPEPPPNYQPDWIIDTEGHTALHWASAMGDIEIMKQLKRFGATLNHPNVKGETPLMRAVLFTNCLDKQSMPGVVKELIASIDSVDYCGATALHHAAAVTTLRQKHHCARYYLDVVLNKMQEVLEPDHVRRILDAQDINGNTAIHIAAKNKARKCVRALMGRGASTDILNNENLTAEDLIQELNAHRKMERYAAASSSPFAPDSNHRRSFQDAIGEDPAHQDVSHISEAAMSIESKVTPLVLEKFHELARSFDEELKEKEESEKEARRILLATHDELEAIRVQILDITYHDDPPEVHEQKLQHLAHLEKVVTSLIEEQQQIQLLARTQHEESKQNGHMSTGDDDLAERLLLAREVNKQQEKRKMLVEKYRDALAMAGAGENGEKYRRLISKCVDQDVETMDENLDSLIDQLKQQENDRSAETIDL
jgi:ankyrin repeat protein